MTRNSQPRNLKTINLSRIRQTFGKQLLKPRNREIKGGLPGISHHPLKFKWKSSLDNMEALMIRTPSAHKLSLKVTWKFSLQKIRTCSWWFMGMRMKLHLGLLLLIPLSLGSY
jgi:hypothetical protein